MRRTALKLAAVFLLVTANAVAQQPSEPVGSRPQAAGDFAPSWEIGAAYSLVRTGSTVPSTSFNMHGGSVAGAFHVNDWLGFVADIGYTTNNNVPPAGFSLNVLTYLFGPRISYPMGERATLFGQYLIGGGHAGGTLYTAGFQQGAAPPDAVNSFALSLGAGLDVSISRNVAIRAVQADWLYTNFPNGGANRQNSMRLSFGLVLRSGR
jgi:hypothetical protein